MRVTTSRTSLRAVTAALALLLAACVQGAKESGVPPTADAGIGRKVAVGTAVTLDGSASHTADRLDTVSFQWTTIATPAGSVATLSGAQTAQPSFTVDVPGDYLFHLVVSDGAATSHPAVVGIEGYRPLAVTALAPPLRAVDVRPDAAIVVELSEAVQPESLTPTSLHVLDGRTPIPGAVDLLAGNRLAVFRPDNPFPVGHRLRVVVTQRLVSLDGTSLPFAYSSLFSVAPDLVDTTRPRVVAVTPSAGETEVGLSSAVMLAFSEAIDVATVDATTFVVSLGGVSTPGTIEIAAAQTRAIFTPAAPLQPDADYLVRVSPGIADTAGNPLDGDGSGAAFQSSFRTASSDSVAPRVEAVYPGDRYEGVPVGAVVTITFSQSLAATAADGFSLTATETGNQLSGSVTLSQGARVLTFVPAGLLETETRYAVRVRGDGPLAVTNLAGIPLDGDDDNAAGGDFQTTFVTSQAQTYDGLFALPATVTVGMPIDVLLTDRDLDTTVSAETITVTCENVTGEREQVVLTETAGTSGAFSGSVATLFGTSAGADDDGTVVVRAGDRLTFIYADALCAAGAARVVRQVVEVVGGMDGALDASAQRLPGEAIVITLDDADQNGSDAALDTVAVVATSSRGETESVVLEETGPASGRFRGSIDTAFGSAGANDDGLFEVEYGDEVTTVYHDPLTAIGSTGTFTALTAIVGGGDGMLNLPAGAFRAGDPLAIEVRDTDIVANPSPGPANDTLALVVSSSLTGDQERVVLGEDTTIAGLFSGTLSTEYGSGPAINSGTLQVQGGAVVTAIYVDRLAANGDNGGIEVSDNANVLWGTDGGAELLEATFVAGDALAVQVTDLDALANATLGAGNDLLAVSVSGNLGGDNETVLLSEDGTREGLFTGSLATRFGLSGVAQDGVLQVRGTEAATLSYTDGFSAKGDTRGVVLTDSAVARTGIDANASIVEPAFHAGQRLTLEVRDDDTLANVTPGGNNDTITVRLTSDTTGDIESVVLDELAIAGHFGTSLATDFAAASVEDGTLQVHGGETVTLTYSDPFRVDGDTRGVDTSDSADVATGFDGLVDIVQSTFHAGETLDLRVTDIDAVANAAAGPGNDAVTVTVTESILGDSLTVSLTESVSSTGLFEGVVATTAAAAAAVDGLLQVTGSDTITLTYNDGFAADGDTRGVSRSDDAVMQIGHDAVVSLTPALFRAGQSLQIAVTDTDSDADGTAGPGNDSVPVTLTDAALGDRVVLTLNESATIAGLFAASVPVALAPVAIADAILQVRGPDTATVRYIDGFRADGSVAGVEVSASAILELGTDGVAEITQLTFQHGDVLQLTVTDTDSDANLTPGPGNDSLAVTVDCANSSDSQTVDLAEDGATAGLFSGAVQAVYGSAVPADGVLQCEGTDTATLTYVDAFCANGDTAGQVVTDTATMAVGADGVLTILKATFTAGESLGLELSDSDSLANVTPGPGNDTLTVTVADALLSDSVVVSLAEHSVAEGLFRGSVATAFSATAVTDSILQVHGADTVTGTYVDRWRSTGDRSGVNVTDVATMETGEDGAAAIAESLFRDGDNLTLSVSDRDRVANPTSGPGNDNLSVAVSCANTGDAEVVLLAESSASEGTFNGSLAVRYGAAGPGDGILQCSGADSATLSYDDAFASNGSVAGQTVTDTATMQVGSDGLVSLTPAIFRSADPLDVTITDTDDVANSTPGAGNDVVTIRLESASTGDWVLLPLGEHSTNEALFAGSVNTQFGAAVADGLLQVFGSDTVTATYSDGFSAAGDLGGTPVVAIATMEVGSNGSADILQATFAGGTDDLDLEVVDTDPVANPTPGPGNDTLTVTVTSTGAGDSVTVPLSEDAATEGRFTQTLTTALGAAVPDSILQVDAPDTATLTYTDMFLANGQTAGQLVTDTAGGTGEPGEDGLAQILEVTFVAGDLLRLRVLDPEAAPKPPNLTSGAGNDNLTVTVTDSVLGDSVTVSLTETAVEGEFTGTVATVFATAPLIDSTLQVHGTDTVTLTYMDMWRANGDQSGVAITDTATLEVGTDAVVDIVESLVSAGATLTLSVLDTDGAANVTAGPGNDLLSVTVSSAALGDSESVSLAEHAVTEGRFGGSLPTALAATATMGDGTLQVHGPDSMTLIYVDTLLSTGDATGVTLTDSATLRVGFDGSIDIAAASFWAGEALQLQVSDADEAANPTAGGANDTLTVTLTASSLGDTETVTLSEQGTAGQFSASVATVLAASASPNDGTLQVSGPDTATAQYTDMLRADGNVSGLLLTDSSTLEVGIDGTVGLTPPTFLAGATLTPSVTDTDPLANSQAGPGNDILTVSIDCANSGDVQTVTLLEDGATEGLFVGSLPTGFGAASSGDGVLQCRGGDTATVTYMDDFCANGDTGGVAVLASAAMQTGTDATVEVTESTFRAGATLNLSVRDADVLADVTLGPANDSVRVTVTAAALGDSVTLDLDESSTLAGLFAGTVPTAFATAALADGILQVSGSDTVTLTYADPLRSDGSTAGVDVTDTAAMEVGAAATVSIAAPTFRAGDLLQLSVTDIDDVADATPGAGNDSFDVTVSGATLADSVTVTLSEHATSPGLFEGSVATEYATAATADAVLQVSGSDTAELRYLDMFSADGNTSGAPVTDVAHMQVGVDAVVNVVEAEFRAGDLLHLAVTDGDSVANATPGAANDSLTVTVVAAALGDSLVVPLAEHVTSAGLFEGTVSTAYATVAAADGLLQVRGADTVTLSYVDMYRANGSLAGETVSDTASAVVGTDGLAQIAQTVFRDGDTLDLSVIDTDGIACPIPGAGNDSVSVTITCSNTGDTQILALLENGTTPGLFEGSIGAVYSGVPVGGDGLLQCLNADTATLQYTDDFTSDGDGSGVSVTDAATMEIGWDGAADIVALSFRAGVALDLTVSDTDDVADATPGAGNDALDVTVGASTLGDTVSLTLSESSVTPGLFEGSVPTAFATAAAADSILQVYGPDTATLSYLDMFCSNGNRGGESTGDTATLETGTDAAVDIVQGTFVPGDTLTLTVSDGDAIANATAGPGNDSLPVSVTSGVESESLSLDEDVATAGLFTGQITTARGAAAVDGVLQVGEFDVATLTVSDMFRANSDDSGVDVSDTCSGGGQLIPLVSRSNTQESTTTIGDVTTDTVISGAAFTAGERYLVLYSVAYGGSGTSDDVGVSVRYGSTVIARGSDQGSLSGVPEAMRIASLHGFYILTADGISDLRITFGMLNAGTAYVTGKSLVAVPLTTLVENTDLWLNQQNGDAAEATATSAFVTLSNLPITVTGGDYLVLISAEGHVTTGTFSQGEAFRVVIDGVTQKTTMVKEWETDNASRAFSYARLHALGAGGHTLRIEVGPGQGTALKEFRRGRIIVVRAAAFDQIASVSQDTDVTTLVAYPSFDDYLTLTYTPSRAEPVVLIGNTLAWQTESFHSVLLRLRNETSGVDLTNFIADDAKDSSTDCPALSLFGSEQVTGPTTYKIQISGQATYLTPHHFQYGDLIVWSMTRQ